MGGDTLESVRLIVKPTHRQGEPRVGERNSQSTGVELSSMKIIQILFFFFSFLMPI